MAQRNLTAAETAAWLGISERTLANWRSKGRGPRYCLLRTRIRYREADISEFLATHARRRKFTWVQVEDDKQT